MCPETKVESGRTHVSFTEDSIFHGALCLRQHRRGYRFTEDAVILGAFASQGGRAKRVVDLGAGCGVIGLMLLHAGVAERVIAVELQPRLAQLARQNALHNGFEQGHSTIRADLRATPLLDDKVDLVVTNPPYRPLSAGHLPSDPERATARHEICCTPLELAHEAARCLSPRSGRLAMIFPIERFQELQRAILDAGLTPSRLRHVKPSQATSASHVLVEAVLGEHDGPCVEDEPLISRVENGARSEEMKKILAGDWDLGRRLRER